MYSFIWDLWFEKVKARYANDRGGMNVLIDKQTGALVGQCGLLVQDVDEVTILEIGYSLLPQHQGKGYATEASVAWLDYGFNQMNIDKMNAYTHSENGASNHILQKVGMNFMEEYLDKDGVLWKWWQMENPND